MRSHLFIAFAVAFFLVLTFSAVYAQDTIQLSSDLIFAVAPLSANKTAYVPILVHLDKGTLTTTSFYADNSVEHTVRGLEPLGWSPQGDMLAILRIQQADHFSPDYPPMQICLVTRAGNLQICFHDHPSFVPGESYDKDQVSMVSWSTDEKFFYFVSENNNRSVISLVKADVSTGQTVDTIYQDSSGKWPMLTWTSDLQYIAVGVGTENGTANPYPVTLINLQTSKQMDLNTLIPKTATYGLVCLNFSPKNTYMSAVVSTQDGSNFSDEIIIFDKQGTIQHTINTTRTLGHLQNIGCPAWQKAEDAIYFTGYAELDPTAKIFKYTFGNQQLSALYHVPPDIAKIVNTTLTRIYVPLLLSPDETQIAFTSSDNPHGFFAVKVVGQNGQAKTFLEPYDYSRYPVWMPPLTPGISDLRTAVATCVTDHGLINSLNAKINAQQWNAFINEVEAQTGKKITQLCANQLINIATYLLNNSHPATTPEPTDHPDDQKH